MNCPECARDSYVRDSRLVEEGGVVRRRRECTACGHRFTSYEISAETYRSISVSDMPWHRLTAARAMIDEVLMRQPAEPRR